MCRKTNQKQFNFVHWKLVWLAMHSTQWGYRFFGSLVTESFQEFAVQAHKMLKKTD